MNKVGCLRQIIWIIFFVYRGINQQMPIGIQFDLVQWDRYLHSDPLSLAEVRWIHPPSVTVTDASDHHPLKPPLSTPTADPSISNSAWAYPLIDNRDTLTGGTGPKAIATHAKTHTAIYIVMISSLTLRGWLLSPSAAIPKPTICPEWDTDNHHFKWGKAIWNSNSFG